MQIQTPRNELCWHDASNLTIEGRGWTSTENPYHRLPPKAKHIVNERHWNLSRCPAGMTVHFSTNAPSLSVKWDAAPAHPGFTGLDLYVKHQNNWRWLAVAAASQTLNEKQLFADIPVQTRHYMLYLPLFHQVEQVELGTPAGFEINATTPRTEKPVVFYGTSITQGSRASRPGMCYTAILGRWLDTPALNLGFSGNGTMEPNFVDLLCELDPAAYVIDCMPNMTEPIIQERVEPAVRKLRSVRPETPIVLIDNMLYCDAFLKPDRMNRYLSSNQAQHAAYEQLVQDGVTNLHHVKDEGLIGTDGEATIDGTHFTDLGYMRFSENLFELLKELTKKPNHN